VTILPALGPLPALPPRLREPGTMIAGSYG
jgi:hypothetical protein